MLASLSMNSDRYEAIRDADWIDDSSIVALSGDGRCIARVRLNAIVRVTCSSGEGPGEFRELASVSGDETGGYIGIENRLRRVMRWSAEDSARSATPLPSVVFGRPWHTDVGIQIKIFHGATAQGQLLLLSNDPSSAGRFLPRLVGKAVCGLCNLAVSRTGSLAYALADTAYRVLRRNATGATVPVIARDGIPLVPLVPSELDSARQMRGAETGRMKNSGLSDASIRNLLRDFKGSEYRPRFSPDGLTFDDEERLWVQRSVARGAATLVDVFGEHGQFISTISLPAGVNVLRTSRNRILGWRPVSDSSSELSIFSFPTFPGGSF